MSTIAEIDAQLLATRDAYAEAFERGDLEAVDAAYALLDDLLDQRIRHLAEKPLASA